MLKYFWANSVVHVSMNSVIFYSLAAARQLGEILRGEPASCLWIILGDPVDVHCPHSTLHASRSTLRPCICHMHSSYRLVNRGGHSRHNSVVDPYNQSIPETSFHVYSTASVVVWLRPRNRSQCHQVHSPSPVPERRSIAERCRVFVNHLY